MRKRHALLAVAVALVSTGALTGTASAEDKVVEVLLPDRAALDQLVEQGADLDHGIERRDGRLVAKLVADDEEIALLRAQGYQIGAELWSDSTTRQRLAERAHRERARPCSRWGGERRVPMGS